MKKLKWVEGDVHPRGVFSHMNAAILEVDEAIPEVDEAYCTQPLESHPSSCRRVNPPSLRVAS